MIILFTNTSDAAKRDAHLAVFSQAEQMWATKASSQPILMGGVYARYSVTTARPLGCDIRVC